MWPIKLHSQHAWHHSAWDCQWIKQNQEMHLQWFLSHNDVKQKSSTASYHHHSYLKCIENWCTSSVGECVELGSKERVHKHKWLNPNSHISECLTLVLKAMRNTKSCMIQCTCHAPMHLVGQLLPMACCLQHKKTQLRTVLMLLVWTRHTNEWALDIT